jgi:hypothetical protein
VAGDFFGPCVLFEVHHFNFPEAREPLHKFYQPRFDKVLAWCAEGKYLDVHLWIVADFE